MTFQIDNYNFQIWQPIVKPFSGPITKTVNTNTRVSIFNFVWNSYKC